MTLHFSESESDSDSDHFRNRKRKRQKMQKNKSVENPTHMKLQASESERIISNSYVLIKASEKMEEDLLDNLALLELDVDTTESVSDSDIDKNYEQYEVQLRNTRSPPELSIIVIYIQLHTRVCV